MLNRVTCACGTGAPKVPLGRRAEPHSQLPAQPVPLPAPAPLARGLGPGCSVCTLPAGNSPPPPPFLVSMATPVEITLKRNETSSFSVWQVGGGELSWERLGKRFEVWSGTDAFPHGVPVLGTAGLGGCGDTPPLWHLVLAVLDGMVRLHVCSILTWWGDTRVLLLPLSGGCQGHEDQHKAPHPAR